MEEMQQETELKGGIWNEKMDGVHTCGIIYRILSV